MNKKKLIIISSIIISISTITFYFLKKNREEKNLPFKIENPIHKNLIQYVNSSGTLQAKDEVTVGSLVAGRVIKIIANDNDVVKKDQLLAILEDEVGYSEIEKFKGVLQEIEAKLIFEEKFYKRQTKLYKANQISTNLFEEYTKNLEVLRSQKKQAKASLDISQKRYDNFFIKSPVDGVVIDRTVNLGQMVTARFAATVLYRIAKDLSKMEAVVDVDEADVGMLKKGQEAIFTVDAFPKLKFKAEIKQIQYLAKNIDGVVTYATILNVNNNDLKLRPGMTTNVDIKAKEANNVLVIRNKALRLNSDILEKTGKKIGFNIEKLSENNIKKEIDNIWILKNENTFKQIKIKTGARQGKFTQIISSNVNETTKIITEIRELERDNKALKQIFSKPGTLGEGK